MCFCVQLSVHEQLRRLKEIIEPFRAGVMGGWEITWVLGSNLGSSARTVCSLNHSLVIWPPLSHLSSHLCVFYMNSSPLFPTLDVGIIWTYKKREHLKVTKTHYKKSSFKLTMVAQVLTPSPKEGNSGIYLWVLGQPCLHRERHNSQDCLEGNKSKTTKAKQKPKKGFFFGGGASLVGFS